VQFQDDEEGGGVPKHHTDLERRLATVDRPPRSIDPAHEMSLKKTLDALNLRRVVVDEKTGACEVSFAWTPRAFSPMGALWGTVQLAWGFALVHYIFYGLFAAIFIYAYGRHDWRVLAACVTVIAAYTPSLLDGSEFRLGRPWDALRTHPIWALSQAYFPARLVRTTPPIDPNKKYVFGWHPHGILILSRIHVYGGVWETLFPGVDIRVLGASPMFKLPGCREICLWMGAVDAGRRTAEHVLKAGKSVVVYPGGSREIFDTDPNSAETRCHLTKRKGFVRLALKHGAELVPVFVFGEKRCYRRLNVPVRLRDWLLRRLKIPLIVFWGRWCTWYPLPSKQTVVFGAPIAPPALSEGQLEPTADQVDELHARYTAAVVELYETHKEAAGYGPEETLKIV